MEKNEYYVIVDLRPLEFMRDGYGEQRISDATVYTTEQEARYEIETYDEPQYFEVYKVEQEISRSLKLIPKKS